MKQKIFLIIFAWLVVGFFVVYYLFRVAPIQVPDTAEAVEITITNSNCYSEVSVPRFPYEVTVKNGKVYIESKEVKGADPKSFSCVGLYATYGDGGDIKEQFYFKDKSRVFAVTVACSGDLCGPYTSAIELSEAEASTFEYVGRAIFSDRELAYLYPRSADGYGKDRFNVYSGMDVVPGFDPATFVNLKSGYIKDAKHVSIFGFNNQTIPDADSVTFEVLGDGYARDAKNAYFYGKIIEGADPTTLVVTGSNDGSFAKDKNHQYKNGELVTN